MSDLLDRLQDMVDFKHDDMDVAREAIEEITRLRAALATARREGMEEALKLVELYAKAALKCKQCGDICHDYYPDNCTGRTQYLESDEYKRILIYDGEYAAMRYFQKHLCRPEMMDAEDAFKALAATIRAAAKEGKP